MLRSGQYPVQSLLFQSRLISCEDGRDDYHTPRNEKEQKLAEGHKIMAPGPCSFRYSVVLFNEHLDYLDCGRVDTFGWGVRDRLNWGQGCYC